MSREISESLVKKAAEQFAFPGVILSLRPFGSGHINDTYLVNVQGEEREIPFILQRMNNDIFKEPEALMENILGVTSFLRKIIMEEGGDPERETLNLVRTQEGNVIYRHTDGSYWRVYQFVEGATCYDQVEKPEDFYQSAVAFGHFQHLLADYPADTLHETIVDFHNTPVRYETFLKAVEEDVKGRAKEVEKEIRFVKDHQRIIHCLADAQARGELPLRVTHNDTKLNNIMIDDATGKAICVIDLDTVMPGLAVNDFGDSIRFGASTGAEDEPDLSKIWCDMELFEIYTKGFIEGCGGSLTKAELEMLPMGAMTMTFECGMRFLTDYLQGDTYFKIHRPDHNLDRCRTQFKLVADMESKEEEMLAIVRKYM